MSTIGTGSKLAVTAALIAFGLYGTGGDCRVYRKGCRLLDVPGKASITSGLGPISPLG